MERIGRIALGIGFLLTANLCESDESLLGQWNEWEEGLKEFSILLN